MYIFFLGLESREAFGIGKCFFQSDASIVTFGITVDTVVPIIVEEKDMISSFCLVRDIYFIQLKDHSQTPQESLGGGFK